MGYESVKVWVCDVCGHRWIAGELVPTHCASSKCRSRKWDNTPDILDRALAQAPPEAIAVELYTSQGTLIASRVRQHDPKTCRVYKCGLCAAITNDK